jgi:hypothetical protein
LPSCATAEAAMVRVPRIVHLMFLSIPEADPRVKRFVRN